MRGVRVSILLAVGAVALGLPGAAWAPWQTISDTAVNVLQVCQNGIRFEYATGITDPHGPEPTAGDRLGVRAGPVETGTNKPSEAATLILDSTFTVPHNHFNVPGLPAGTELRHYYGTVTLFWTSQQAVGTALRLIFEFPDDMGNSVDLPFNDDPPLTIAACTLSVSLRTFTATRTRSGVRIRWRTGSELETLGFNVYRGGRGHRAKLNRSLIPGRSPSGWAYSWLDRAAPRRALTYWLQEVELDGSREWHGPVKAR